MRKTLLVFTLFSLAFILSSCLGGKDEETMSIELNISGGADLAELEKLQNQVKEQKDQLKALEQELASKSSSGKSGGKAATAEIKKIKEEIRKQKSAVVSASKMVETVKVEKGKYVWNMFMGVPSHDFYNGFNILPPLDFKWKFRAGSGFSASPIMDEKNVYVGSLDNNFYALDKLTGQKTWEMPSQGAISSTAALYGGVLYYGTETGMVLAVTTKGKMLWKKRLGAQIMLSSPAVYSKVVIIGCMDKILYALDRKTGEPAWKFEAFGPIASSPTIANGMVYIGALDKNLYALDVDSGQVQWQYQAGGFISSTPAENEGVLYFGSDDKKLYALDSISGSVKWTFQAEGFIQSSPVVKEGVIYFGSNDRNVYAVSADGGKLLWKTPADSKVLATPFVVNSLVYIAAGKELMVLDAKTGEKKWSQVFDYRISASCIGEAGVVYVGDTDTSFMALESVAK